MADTKKYVSEFEVQSNIDEALKQLQKYYVEFTKMPSAVESFNKALKKSTDMENKFYEMMSAIPKTMKRLSELSKIELLPRKELEKIADAVQLVSGAAKNLQGKSLIDVDEVRGVVGEFENIVLEMGELESKHESIITKADKYSKLLTGIGKIQKDLSNNSDKYTTSTKSVFNSYTGVKSLVSKITNELKKAKEEGKVTKDFLNEYDSKLKGVKEKIGEIDKKVNNVNQLFSSVNNILENSKNVADDMQNAIAKMSYEKSIDEVKALKNELEDALKVKKSEDEIHQIRNRLEEVVESLNTAVNANERLLAETKTTNEAFNLMTRMTGEIYEEMQEISNIELKKQFNEARKVIESMTRDLEKSIMIDKASNSVIREKMGLLKNQGDKLREIINRQIEIKNLEQQSISATVKRAREQDKVNMAYAKQILSQRKNLGGLVDAINVYKKNIPTKAIAIFGETGVVAAKAIGTAFKGLAAVFAPLMGLMGGLSLIKTLFDMERQVKGARKQMFMMAMDTNTVSEAISDLAKGGILAESKIEDMTKGLDNMKLISMGINLEQAMSAMSEFQKQGFKATAIYENLSDTTGGLFAQAASLGIEIGDLAAKAGTLRTEFGFSLDETSKAFEQLRQDSKTAGITVSIFFDKVMNASVGLALWGQKIDLVSDVFANLVKNMKLPEAVSTKLAENMVKGFSGMSTEMQITTYMLGKGKTQWKKYADAQNAATETRLAAIDQEMKSASGEKKNALFQERASLLREKRTIDEYDSLKGLSGQLARMRKMDVGSQIMTQLSAVGLNFSGDIEALDTKFAKSFFEMEKLGETFGIDRDTMMGYKQIVSTLASNVKGFKKSAESMGIDDIKGLIGALSEPQKNASTIQAQLVKLTKKGNKVEISSFAKQLSKQDEFSEYQKELLDISKMTDPSQSALALESLSKLLTKIDTGLNLSAKQTKDALDKANVAAAKRAGAAMLSQTKSTEDAINNTITKILRNGFRFLEKLVNMFAFINRDELKQFNELNDRLDKNRQVAEQNLSALTGEKTTLDTEIARLEQEPAPKSEEEKKAREEQIALLKKQSNSVGEAISSYEQLIKSTSDAAGVLGKEGELSESSLSATKAADEEAKAASKKSAAVIQGRAEITKSAYGQQIYQGAKNLGGEYETTVAGEKRKRSLLGFTGILGGFGEQKTAEAGANIGMSGGVSTTPTINTQGQLIQQPSKPIMTFTQQQLDQTKHARGGVAPGLSFKGDKLLASLNSGELIVPEKTWQQYTSSVGQNSLQSLIDSMKIGTEAQNQTNNTQNRTINDNRTIQIYVNQNDRNQVEKIVANAMYTDKK